MIDRNWEGVRGGEGREKQLEAGVAFREAANRYANLIARHPDALGYRAWYALFLQFAAINSFQSSILQQSEELFQKSIKNWTALIELDSDNALSWEALPIAYEIISRVQHELGNHIAAEHSQREAELSRIYRDLNREE